MSIDKKRRDFSGMMLAGVAGVGMLTVGYGFKSTWDPLPSVLSLGFTTVDLNNTKAGQLYMVEWRGKPVFILQKSDSMKKNDDREFTVNGKRFSVMIGLCTHLGCIPSFRNEIFKCACHGGEFDSNGVNYFGPPPRPLDIPPFKIDGSRIILGETGSEYKRLASASLKS